MKSIGKAIPKKDAMSLLTGKPVYTDDIAPKDCLIIKLLRSPHANAYVTSINTAIAKKIPGIVDVFTHEDVPKLRFTQAGQTYPEPSPYDRYIMDQHVRYVGDPVAIVAGETEDAVDKALKTIKVEYEVLEPILDVRVAKDNPILVHPEEDWLIHNGVGADNKRNVIYSKVESDGDLEEMFAKSDLILEETYHTKANCQTMMETFRSYAYKDYFGRLVVVSSTQVPFHIKRIVANALGLPKSQIRVIKPRIGGGFGAKQTGVTEVYAAFVTMKTGRPAKIIFTRQESMTVGSPRHEMYVTVKMGLNKEGKVLAIDEYVLSNTGAHGEHGPTTVTLAGHKPIPLCTPLAFRFACDVVYTNVQPAGAYRGYGATQGIYAVESTLMKAADKLGIDPITIQMINLPEKGTFLPSYYNATLKSCHAKECVKKAAEMIGWNEKYPVKDLGNGKVRALGMSMSMQGSGISNVDVGSVIVRVDEDGHYILMIGASDMGTGCDTILAQMTADCMECSVDDITVHGVDTDTSPYDSGSYASSTTYITGMAVVKACDQLKNMILDRGAEQLGLKKTEVEFLGDHVAAIDDPSQMISMKDLATLRMAGSNETLEATASHYSPDSPPPFMCGMVELEVDKYTGEMKVVDYVATVDCGTVINESLARVQAEGGIAQGIGMTIFEDITYTEKGRILEDSFMQYKIPCRQDIPSIRVEFESSYEPTGPFGAKSIGEVVLNTPLCAITHAVHNATGLWFNELPITPEKIVKGLYDLK